MIVGILVFTTVAFIAFRFIHLRKLRQNPVHHPYRSRLGYADIVKSVFPSYSRTNTKIEDANYTNLSNCNYKYSELKFQIDQIDKFTIGSAIGESAWYGTDIINNMLSVDQNVYDALSQLAGKQMDSISDLHSYLSHWDTDWTGHLTAINNLQGYVAEFVVADHLRSLGHTVTFPEASNTPGYDIMVDGHPYNVKDVLDMSSIKEHFLHHPDIGVISNYDVHGLNDTVFHIDPTHGIDQVFAASAVADHSHIIDNALSHDAVLDQTHHAADAITGNIDMHFPIITAALSSYREVKILMKGHTTLMTSVKNIGLDVAGTGIGAAAGAKAGAAIGTFFGPGIGIAIGGIIGAIGGAIGGRLVTNNIKKEDMVRANNQYTQAVESYKNNLAGVESYCKNQITNSKIIYQQQLKNLADESKRLLSLLNSSLVQKEKEAYTLSSEQIDALFLNQKEFMEIQLEKTRREIGSNNIFIRYIWPNKQIITLRLIEKYLLEDIALLDHASIKINETSTTQEQKTHIALEILGNFELNTLKIKQHLEKLNAQIEENKNHLAQAIETEKRKLAEERVYAFKRLLDQIELLKKNAENELRPFSDSINSTQENLIAEMRKLGIEPGS
ncbi:MAG: hypothetical protein LWX56_05055 [Ignavibacteria bacterium]|nr:hypothetical protein [Ignavibacteria bacterium]